jgi:hypothetical protein
LGNDNDLSPIGCAMRRLAIPLLLSALLTGCEDGLGIGSSCDSEMRQVRQSEGGRPPDEVQRSALGGNVTEVWRYFDTGRSGRQYTFRWGPAEGICSVTGPVRFSLVPVT